jgi:hypothetical protein
MSKAESKVLQLAILLFLANALITRLYQNKRREEKELKVSFDVSINITMYNLKCLRLDTSKLGDDSL